MSQIIVDDHIHQEEVVETIRRWITVQRLRDLRPGETIKDERIPQLLRQLKQPTLVTIDDGFWDKRWCDPQYGILYFALRADQQDQIPDLLRALLRLPGFKTKAARMGKVARVSSAGMDYWEWGCDEYRVLKWPAG